MPGKFANRQLSSWLGLKIKSIPPFNYLVNYFLFIKGKKEERNKNEMMMLLIFFHKKAKKKKEMREVRINCKDKSLTQSLTSYPFELKSLGE